MSTELTPDRYLESLRVDADRLIAVAGRGLDAPVPRCPGWTVRDAVIHTGEVFWHKVMWMRVGDYPEEWPTEPAADETPLDYFKGAYDALLDELVARGPDAATSTWWPPDQTVGFWYRRMAQEIAVHRVDVEAAHDDVTPIPDDVAVDGVDEVLRVFLPAFGTDAPAEATGQRIAVESPGQRWVIALEPTGALLDGTASVDATVSGSPHAVDLWLWGRAGIEELTVAGDTSAVDVLRAWLVDATQ